MKKRFRFPQFGSVMSLRPRLPLLRSLLICGVGLLSSLVVVLSGTSVAQVPNLPSSNATPTESAGATTTSVTTTSVTTDGTTDGTTDRRAPQLTNAREAAATEAETPGSKSIKDSGRKLGPRSQYILDFSRSPEIGNRFRMEGVYGESRLGFTRPRGWTMRGIKAIIRFQHSPSLVGARSNLVVRVNDTSIGSVPLNLKNSQIGEAVITIPPNLIQDDNEISLIAQQENSPTCSNPTDKSLWTEVLPDSKLVLDYQPEVLPLDFSSYPYPFFDRLSLEPTRLNYLMPAQTNEAWLTSVSRFQTNMGRLADFRPVDTQLIQAVKNFRWNDRLVIIGTPAQQPLLKTLKLPATLAGGQFVGRDKTAYGDETGLLMLTSLNEGSVPVLVVTGNSDAAVRKAAQFLVQPQNSQIGTSALIEVNQLANAPAPARRDWPRFLPSKKQFELKEIQNQEGKPYKDVTVRGSSAPPVVINFWGLPDDRFVRGNSMTLRYSYGAQADPKNSTVSVAIDDVTIGSKKLSAEQGGNRETFTVDLPENLITPTSKIRVEFKLLPKDVNQGRDCGRLSDQHLWGTLHADTNFSVTREIGANLPDLKLLTSGFPLGELQDFANMAIVMPDQPAPADIMTLLKFSERMGRISRAASVQHEVHLANTTSEDVKKYKHLVTIGTRDRLPLMANVFQTDKGFNLSDALKRQLGQTQIQTLPNADGIIKSVMSPWNPERVLIALSAQTEPGLKQVQDVLSSDAWFYQLQGDTALMAATATNPNPYDPNGYRFQFLQESSSQTRENINPINKIRRFLQAHFYLLPIGIVLVSLLMYGIAQRYLKRVAGGGN